MKVRITKIPMAQDGMDMQNPFEMSNEESIDVIPDSAKDHEEGGEILGEPGREVELEASEVHTTDENGNPQRILQATSDKRNDAMSKHLKLTPSDIERLTGFKAKGYMSHAKAFTKAEEFWANKTKSLEKKIESNYDYAKKSNSKYAANSLDENLKMLDRLPTSMDIFNSLFEHQESLKEIPTTGKYATGGKPPYASTDNASKQAEFNIFYNDLVSAGYSGPKDISSMQKFLVEKYPDLVDHYMKTVPNTNKGINDPNLNSREAFNDNLWWYRNMAPKDIKFKTQEEYDAFVKGKDNVNSNGINYYVDPNNTDYMSYRKRYYNPSVEAPTPNQPATAQTPTEEVINKSKAFSQRSRFNEPLRWFDVANPIENLINSDRIPVNYDAPELTYQSPKYIDPRPQLQNATASYNAVLNQLPQNAVGYANAANVFASKYNIDNQVLGNIENQNNQIYNNNLRYEDQMRNQQSTMDYQARQAFEQKYLTSLENQRQQRHLAKGTLYNTLATNRKLNREGDLVMSMFNFYDQYGNYNGNPYQFNTNSMPDKNILTDAKGKKYYIDPTTKTITSLK